MRWLAAAVVAGCAAAPRIDAEPAFDAGGDASPASGGNAQGGAPAGGAGGSAGSASGGAPGVAVEVVAPCAVEVSVPGGTAVWAEAPFPGKSAAELVHAVAFREPIGGDQLPPGYTYSVQQWTAVRDGAVAAPCGTKGYPMPSQIRFRLP